VSIRIVVKESADLMKRVSVGSELVNPALTNDFLNFEAFGSSQQSALI
jgi:hypothetical protein